jgi:glutamate racemase
MPYRHFLYLGDTARVPYGRKPRAMVEEFARGIAAFLCAHGVEAVIVACNTASSAALPALAEECPVPVFGVIEPGVEAAARVTRTGSVGVIGTAGTIRSRAYQERLESRGLHVWARACPLFVHLVEEGLADSEEAELLARYYLGDRPPLDTVILGCTHYPLLRDVIQRVAGPSVRLVDSAEVTAEAVCRALGPTPASGHPGRIVHYVTGDPIAFEHTAGVIGEVDGTIIPLSVAELQQRQAPERIYSRFA